MRAVLLLSLLMLAACREATVPAPTVEESKRLDEADAMLNEAAANELEP
jgi:hypothetical protein